MSENWSAVAKAIGERVKELGWRQRELAERSNVSQAIVREVQHHTVERRRSPRTLESLSVTLGWHPEHLSAVLEGRTPQAASEPAPTGDVSARLAAIEYELRRITNRLDEMNSRLPVASGRDDESSA